VSALSGRVAIITGATSGIGAATAIALGRAGASVLLTGRDTDRAATTASVVEAAGGTAVVELGDITDSAFCDRLVGKAVDQWGRLDILANVAGVNHRADATGTTDADWQWVMATNVDAVFYLSRAAVAAMIDSGNGGSIVNLGSTVGMVGTAGMTAYCVSKGAVLQITRAMALDHAAAGIRVNAVCPGAVDTPMLVSGHADGVTAADVHAMNIDSIPQGRIPGPDEVADLISYLASDASRHITGAAIPIDGGYTAQ